MYRWTFETMPLDEAAEGERARRALASRMRSSGRWPPRPRPRTPMRVRPRSPWVPVAVPWGTYAAAPADCGCAATDDAAAFDDDLADGGERFAFEVLELDLESPPARPLLRRGARGAAVGDLQARLAAAGHDPGAVDGIFGARTDAAVRAFQRAAGLVVDGVVGARTWGALSGGAPLPAPAPAPGPSGSAARWVLPADVRAAGDAQTVRYDDAPPWSGSPGNCSGSFTAGAQRLREHILASFPGVTSIGGYSCRPNTATPSLTSIHGVGRALDIMITPVGARADAAVGDPIANWLVRHAGAIGVQYVIWNRTRWAGHRPPGTKVADYTGPNPHIDHVHAEINLDAAARRTPWYLGG